MQAGSVVGGRFLLEQRLGEGGMGVVWEATNLRTHRTVALKILKAETKEQRHRLFREGRIAGKLHHPNIVEVHDVIELDDGTPAIVMERLTGESLRALLVRDKRVPLPRVAPIFGSIARALVCAHALGVVHRDLKPENVFVARDPDGHEQIKVLDFGIARLTAAEGDTAATSPLTDTGDVIGTPSYMAPEQVFGERDVDTRADVWSFGVILYECLTGRKPFVGANFGQIFKQVAMGPIVPIEEFAPEIPCELREMIMRMLARDRAQRPGDWNDIIAVLERGHALPPPPLPRPPPRARLSRIAFGGVVVASALLGGWIVTTRLRAPERAPHPDASTSEAIAASLASVEAVPSSSADAQPSASARLPPKAPRPLASSPDRHLPGGVHGTSPY